MNPGLHTPNSVSYPPAEEKQNIRKQIFFFNPLSITEGKLGFVYMILYMATYSLNMEN